MDFQRRTDMCTRYPRTIVAKIDIISLHLPLANETFHYVDEKIY